MKSTTEQVEGLQQMLEVKMVDVEQKKADTEALVKVVTAESEVAAVEQEKANIEEEKTMDLAAKANKEKADANKELEEALPAMKAAEEAVKCLNKASIQELKALPKPPEECVQVTKAVMLLKGEKKNFAWQNAQKMLKDPPKFLDEIIAYDGREIDQWILDQLAPIVEKDFFNFEKMLGKSQAAAYLCKWVVNIVRFNSIYKRVKPLMDSAEAAES